MDTGVSSAMTLSIIAAVAENGVIGNAGNLPWKLPADLKRFKQLTLRHIVICGRKTYDSIIERLGKPLPDRTMIVLTHRPLPSLDHEQRQNVIPVLDWKQALIFAGWLIGTGKDPEVFVIGGAEIYKMAMPEAQRLYLTRVHANPEGDTLFPTVALSEWQTVTVDQLETDTRDQYPCSLEVHERRAVQPKPRPQQQYLQMENARYDEQREVMERLAKLGVCPFCPEHISKAEVNLELFATKHWHVHVNRWPYDNTRLHLLVIHRQHLLHLDELSPEAAAEIVEVAAWARAKYEIKGGGLVMRFGDPAVTGATVHHLHWHLVVADVTDRSDPKYQPVRARLG